MKNPKMDALLRFRFMSQKFLNLAHPAANFPECTMLVDSTLDILGKQIEEKINTSTSTFQNAGADSADANPLNDLLINASLKKKDVETKSSKRKRTGSIRSTRLEKREKMKLHLSLVKRLMVVHRHKMGYVHYFLNPHNQVVHKHKHKLASLKC